MQEISLNGTWKLTHCPLGEGEGREYTNPRRWDGERFKARVPGQVHTDLVREGRIEEPLVKTNTRDCLWMESEEWWYHRTLQVPADFPSDRIELVFDGLDTIADVYLDGEKIGHHENMQRELVIDVTGRVTPGETHQLAVRTDPGLGALEGWDPWRYKNWGPEPRISCIRRAQFTLGWDWAPRLATTGIWRPVALRGYNKWKVSEVFAHTSRLTGNKSGNKTATKTATKATVKVSAQVENLDQGAKQVRLQATLTAPDGRTFTATSKPVSVARSKNLSVTVEVDDPQLWWPRPLGKAHLHDIEVKLLAGTRPVETVETRIGIRTVEVEQEPLGKGEESFIVKVNGERVFCKGANWVPADSIISRVDRKKYRKLIQLADEANFNMLRIWGGGIYEDEEFFKACDERGIMVWHDFMYACGFYPDDVPEFAEEARVEAEAAVKRLRNHPSIALWCGNNENDWFDYIATDIEKRPNHFFGGKILYHEILPDVVKRLDPSRFYWPSSPYGGKDPNCEEIGDRHAWNVSILHKDPKERIYYPNYLKERGKFNSEYGVLGPPVKATLNQFLDKKDQHPRSEGWKHHNNEFEKQVIQGMLQRFYGNPAKMEFDHYLLAAQMIQAEALRMSLDAFRSRKFDTAGALFWMYNDCWPAVGWTIVDYYLNRKPSYYYVRDANAPLRVAGWYYNDELSVHLINDTLKPFEGVLETKLIKFTGEVVHQSEAPAAIPVNGRAGFEHDDLPPLKRHVRDACLILSLTKTGRERSRSRVFLTEFKNLRLPESTLKVKETDKGLAFTSDQFVWMVHVEIPNDATISDNAFDVLPGEEKVVQLKGAKLKDVEIRSLSPVKIRK